MIQISLRIIPISSCNTENEIGIIPRSPGIIQICLGVTPIQLAVLPISLLVLPNWLVVLAKGVGDPPERLVVLPSTSWNWPSDNHRRTGEREAATSLGADGYTRLEPMLDLSPFLRRRIEALLFQ